MAKTLHQLFDELDRIEGRIKAIETQILEAAGWASTCELPGSLWLWKRGTNPAIYLRQSEALEVVKEELARTA